MMNDEFGVQMFVLTIEEPTNQPTNCFKRKELHDLTHQLNPSEEATRREFFS